VKVFRYIRRHANPFVRASTTAQAEAHSRVPRHGRFWFFKLLRAEWNRIEVSALASQVAYSLIFAIPSLILFLMAMAAVIDQHTGLPVATWMREAINDYAPREIKEVLNNVVDGAVSQVGGGVASVNAVIAIVIAIWGASSGVNSLMNACNRAYGVPDTRSFVAKRLMALILTGIFSLFALTTAVVFIGGQRLEHWTFDQLDLSESYRAWWVYLRWPVIVLPIATALLMLYSIASIARPPLRWSLPGALAAAGAWILLLWGFQYVLEAIGPSSPYGAAGSVLVFLFFLHTTGRVFILGAAINGLLVRFFRPMS
jgi:membrane protein